MALQYSKYTAQVNGTPVSGNSYTGQFGLGHSTKNAGSVIAGFGAAVNAGSLSVISDQGEGVRAAVQMVKPNYTNSYAQNHVNDSSLLTGERLVTAYAISSGDFGKLTANRYIIRRVSTIIAGLSNNHTLLSGGSDFGYRRSIAYTESFRGSFLAGLTWTTVSGLNSQGYNNSADLPIFTYVYSNTVSATGQNSATATNPPSLGSQDAAARPSYATPGQLTYKSANPVITNDVYKSHTD